MAIYERMKVQGRGGALPTYRGQGGSYVPGAGVNARVSGADARILAAGANAQSEALGNLGKAIGISARAGLSAYEDYSKTKATELFTKYRTQMRQSLYGENGILTREGESAFTSDADTMARSRELRSELLKDMEGSLAESMFNRLADEEEADFSLKAQEYEGKQYRVYQDRTDTAAFEEAAETAMHSYMSLPDFQKNVGQALYYQEQLLRRAGYAGEALERGLKEGSSKIFAGAINQALASDDIAGARNILAEGSRVFGDDRTRMTSDDMAEAEESIRNRADALQEKAEAAARRREAAAEKAFVQGTSASIIAQLDQYPSDWTAEQKEAKLVQLTAGIEDPKQRRAVRAQVKADLDDKELVRKAGVVEELGQLDRTFEQNPNMTTTEKLAMIRTGNFSDETKKKAEKSIMDVMEGKDNTAHSAAGLAAYRRWFDSMGGNVTPDQEKAMMLDLGLNSKDRQAAEEYKGARLEYPQQHVFALIDSVKGKGAVNETGKNRIYDAVIQEAKSRGKALTDKEIKAIIFKQDVEGYVAGSKPGRFGSRSSMTYGEALRKGGSMGLFRPDVPEDTATQIKVRLEMEKPWMTLLSEDMRDALVQTVYLQEQFGIPLALSAAENKAFKAAMDAYNKRTNR